ncbi:hypothetical protein ABZP36_026928 [Zizania latifolia]
MRGEGLHPHRSPFPGLRHPTADLPSRCWSLFGGRSLRVILALLYLRSAFSCEMRFWAPFLMQQVLSLACRAEMWIGSCCALNGFMTVGRAEMLLLNRNDGNGRG